MYIDLLETLIDEVKSSGKFFFRIDEKTHINKKAQLFKGWLPLGVVCRCSVKIFCFFILFCALIKLNTVEKQRIFHATPAIYA